MKVNYLRLSVTDFCNLSCIYCQPKPIKHLNREELLRFEEIRYLIKLMVSWGINKIRITGGEPLRRRGIVSLVRMLSNIKGIKELVMTTNGVELEKFASELKKAGLSRVNISLDSLNRKKFVQITGKDKLIDVLRGIEAAKENNLHPIKINVVVLKGINEDEILDFVRFGSEKKLIIRFIEYMQINQSYPNNLYLPNFVVKQIIEKHWGPLEPVSSLDSSSARYFKPKDSNVLLGFISPVSSPFCSSCNRLRLTAEGKLYPCLLENFAVDLKKALRRNDEVYIKHLFDWAIKNKSRKYRKLCKTDKFMCQIGG